MHHFAVKYLTQYGKGDTMTKIAMFILLTFCVPAYATTMCALEDTTAVILDPSVNGTGYKRDVNTFTWNTTFPYGTIYGVAACLSVGGGHSGTMNYDLDAGGGEKEGVYCWCKMTHPASSRWLFRYNFGAAIGCASSCDLYCGTGTQGDAVLRSGLFGSVGK